MLTQPLLQQLHELRLRGMAAAIEQQLVTPQAASLTFDEYEGQKAGGRFESRQDHLAGHQCKNSMTCPVFARASFERVARRSAKMYPAYCWKLQTSWP